MAKVVVARLSALGDVALLVPVMASVAARYPQHQFVVLTRTPFAPLFDHLSPNVSTLSIDPKGEHKGIGGYRKVLREIKDAAILVDQHNVLRTQFLRWALVPMGKRVRHINKGRTAKKKMIETKQIDPPLPSTIERYRDTFARAGLDSDITFTNLFDNAPDLLSDWATTNIPPKHGKWIGIAPFAKHAGKIYPAERMERIVATLAQSEDTNIFLFGGGENENEILSAWQSAYPCVTNMAGKFDLMQELRFMSQLDVMVSMDSANMHLASLVGVPVVSIWGATHPHIGFYGFGQDVANAVQIDLHCRPCSVFGNVPCSNEDKYACMNTISEAMVLEKINAVFATG